MNWYKGNIAEAVNLSKTKNAIFVVYVEGKDEATEKLTKFINEPRIRTKLESEDFVAIKIESDSQTYMQFATIYQVVPVPSIFFIGRSGTPLEIGTAVLKSTEELEQKIDKVLAASGKSTTTPASASSTSFIAAEQSSNVVAAKTPEPVVTLADESDGTSTAAAAEAAPEQPQEIEVVCEGDVCFKRPKASAEKAAELKVEEQPATSAAAVESPKESEDADAKLEETRKKLEQQRRERIEAEKKLEKERELQRRREGKELQSLQEWQKEQELKELKETRRRERMEEQTARERIRAQIAADRAERARKFAMPGEPGSNNVSANSNDAAGASAVNSKPQMAPLDADSTRLQFRFGSGQTAMQVFQCQDTLGMVRAYVRTELLPGTGIKDFTLATTYPKREFSVDDDDQTLAALVLFPSAVILVLGRESTTNPATIIARSGGLLNMLTAVFWTIVAPVMSTMRYFRNWFTGGNGGGTQVESGANKRANEGRETPNDVAKRRNLERFGGTGNVSGTNANTNGDNNTEGKPYRRYGGSNIHRIADNRKDSDDENATWNGNSTQQQ